MGMVVWEAKALQLLELAEDVKGKQISFFSLQYHWKNKEEEVRPLLKRNRWPTDNWHSQGWGISSLLCLDFHQQSLIALCVSQRRGSGRSRKELSQGSFEEPQPMQVWGPCWDASEGAQGSGWCHGKTTCYHLWKVMEIWRGTQWWEKAKYCTHVQKEQGQSKRPQTGDLPQLPCRNN